MARARKVGAVALVLAGAAALAACASTPEGRRRQVEATADLIDGTLTDLGVVTEAGPGGPRIVSAGLLPEGAVPWAEAALAVSGLLRAGEIVEADDAIEVALSLTPLAAAAMRSAGVSEDDVRLTVVAVGASLRTLKLVLAEDLGQAEGAEAAGPG